jgi:hypothetical protein
LNHLEDTMKLVNLTPHPVVIVAADGATITIPPSGTVARCTVTRSVVGTVTVETVTVPVTATVLGQVEHIPEPEPETLFIVSRVVAEAARDRDDLVVPDDVVRDDQGRVIGCRALARV